MRNFTYRACVGQIGKVSRILREQFARAEYEILAGEFQCARLADEAGVFLQKNKPPFIHKLYTVKAFLVIKLH